VEALSRDTSSHVEVSEFGVREKRKTVALLQGIATLADDLLQSIAQST
jgi:hypothetical protein